MNDTIKTIPIAPEEAACGNSEAEALATAEQVVPRTSSTPMWYLISNPLQWTMDPTAGDVLTTMSVVSFAVGGVTMAASLALAAFERHRRTRGYSYAAIE